MVTMHPGAPQVLNPVATWNRTHAVEPVSITVTSQCPDANMATEPCGVVLSNLEIVTDRIPKPHAVKRVKI